MREYRIINADVLDGLRQLPDASVNCCVTSPPYYGLRNYGVDGQIGLEPTPEQYVARMVECFREVRRVLRPDGTLWLNLGDSYASGGNGTSERYQQMRGLKTAGAQNLPPKKAPAGMKPKDLVGIPWMVAFALRADGWYLRSDIIWHKPNPMPESVTDRPTKAHEYLFLLSKSERYYYDAAAIAEDATTGWNGSSFDDERDLKLYPNIGRKQRDAVRTAPTWDERKEMGEGPRRGYCQNAPTGCHRVGGGEMRNKRSVWTVTTEPFPEAHFATFPTELIKPCILAGSPEGGTVLDSFNGSGTTGVVALRADRSYIGIELNPAYVQMARRRIANDAPLFNMEATA